MNNTTYTKILCKFTIFLQMTSLTLPTLFKVLKYSKLTRHKVISKCKGWKYTLYWQGN